MKVKRTRQGLCPGGQVKELLQAGGMVIFLDIVDEVGKVRTKDYWEEVRCLLRS